MERARDETRQRAAIGVSLLVLAASGILICWRTFAAPPEPRHAPAGPESVAPPETRSHPVGSPTTDPADDGHTDAASVEFRPGRER